MGFSLWVLLITTGCSSLNQTMREPMSSVKFTKKDFLLSEQVSAEAKTVTVLGIDWARLFSKKTGTIDDQSGAISSASIPVIGYFVSDKTKNYALYNLMAQNSGYDVVFYPQYRTKVLKPVLFGFITKITTVKATARLGKLKGDSDLPMEKSRLVSAVQQENRSVPAVQQESRRKIEQTQARENENDNSPSTNYNTPISSEDKIKETKGNNEIGQISKPVGGEQAYNEYIEKNLRPLTKYDDCNNLHGKVILSFNVDKQGRPVDINIIRPLCRTADREAIRLLQNGPNWTVSNGENRLEINF